jgi:glycosyltransferase involved in cell wall biosynthesis
MAADGHEVKVAIIVVSYNALAYARQMLRTVHTTVGVSYEIVVVDNHSDLRTRLFWTFQQFRKRINRLALLDSNTFFAEGNNIGARMASRSATHYLLLNTDCEIRDPAWLQRMLAVHREGATGLRYVTSGAWPRADGFCLLVDAHCWEDGLDEAYQWWWSITGLEARLLRQGRSVQAVRDYDTVVKHHGGKSGKAFQAARSGDTDPALIAGWFEGRQVTVIERLPDLP